MAGIERESTIESFDRLPVMLGSDRRRGRASGIHEGGSRSAGRAAAFSHKHFSRASRIHEEGLRSTGRGMSQIGLQMSSMASMRSDLSWDMEESFESEELSTSMRLVNSFSLKAVILGSLLVNALQTGVEADREIGLLGNVLQYAVTVIWLLEACLKVYTHGPRRYLRTFTMAFELISLCLAILEVCIVPYAFAQWPEVSSRLVTALFYSRLFRLARVAFIIGELQVMISGLVLAIKQLVWVIALISLVLYALAVVASRMVGHDCDEGYLFWEECEDMFGSTPKSMISLLELMTLDMQAVRPLLQGNPLTVLMLGFFFMVTSFGLLNIITGVVVDTILAASADTKKELDELGAIRKQEDLENLRGILRQILKDEDLKDDDQITLHEFLGGCRRVDVQALLQNAGIPVFNKALARRLFQVLDSDGAGEISIDAFMARTSNLLNEGRLSLQDHTLLLMDVRLIHRHVACLEKSQALLHRKIDQVIRPDQVRDQQSNPVPKSLAPALISGAGRRSSSEPAASRVNSRAQSI